MLSLNPETLRLEGQECGRSYSADEFALLVAVPPDCPVCGTPVTIARIDVTLNEEDERRHGRSYIPGMWACPRYCNPRTGERWHGDWKFETWPGGWRYTCSCGVEESGTRDDRSRSEAIHAEHGGRTR